jgi:hypothetical protein
MSERRFMRDGFRLLLGHHGSVVDALSQLPQVFAVVPELLPQHIQRQLSQVADPLDAQSFEDAARHLAHAPQPAHGQRIEELLYLIGLDHDESIRLLRSLAILARNLFGATPTEATKRNRWRISCLIARPISTADPNRAWLPVTSRNASSSDNGSTSGV